MVWWVRLGRLFSPWKVRWCRPCICLLWGCPSCPEDVPWLSLLVVEHLVWVRAFSNRLKMFKNSFRGCEYCILPYLQSKNLARTSQATQTAWSHFTCNFPKCLQKLCSKSVKTRWLQKNQSSMLSVFRSTDTTVWTYLNPMSGVTQVACSGGCLSHHVNSQVAGLHRPLGRSRILSPGQGLTSAHSGRLVVWLFISDYEYVKSPSCTIIQTDKSHCMPQTNFLICFKLLLGAVLQHQEVAFRPLLFWALPWLLLVKRSVGGPNLRLHMHAIPHEFLNCHWWCTVVSKL